MDNLLGPIGHLSEPDVEVENNVRAKGIPSDWPFPRVPSK